MATTIEEAAIPATVTISGEELLRLIADLRRAEETILDENGRHDTRGIESLGCAIDGMFATAFGRMFRDCDLGTEEPDCQCLACNGDMTESGTPLYRRLLEFVWEGHERQSG